MPISVLDTILANAEIRIDISLFVQRPYLGNNYLEHNNEEDIDMKNQYKIKNLKDPIRIREAASKKFVDTLFNDPNMIKHTSHVEFNDKNLNEIRFIKIKSLPAINQHRTP